MFSPSEVSVRVDFVYAIGGKAGLLSNMLTKGQPLPQVEQTMPMLALIVLCHGFTSAHEALSAPCLYYFNSPLCMERINHFLIVV